MKHLKTKLTVLLAAQLLLAAGLYWSGLQQQTRAPSESLLTFNSSEIDKLKISADGVDLEIVKIDGHWQLPQFENLPATSEKLDNLLTNLGGLMPGWPTSTTASSHQRFEVGEDNFQRHLQLFKGDKNVADLLLGTSPGFRKVHARVKDQDAVYAVKLNHFELSAKSEDWLDKSLLAERNLEQIKGQDYVLLKSEDEWQFEDVSAQKPGELTGVNKSKANELIASLENLSVQSIAQTTPQGEAKVIEAMTRDQRWRYQFIAENEKFFANRDDRDIWFSISKADYEKITQPNKQQLAIKVEQSDEELTEGATTKS